MTEPQDSTTPEPTVERVQVTHLPGRCGGRITHPWQWELTAPDGEIRYFDTKREALAWWDENKPNHYAMARYLGADAALTNVVDHYTMSESDARSILDDVDPEVLDRYPEPNLSGEWADDLSYNSLILEVTGAGELREVSSDDQDAIATAWEEGRDEIWPDALQATALRVLGDVARACEVEAANDATVASLRAAAGL